MCSQRCLLIESAPDRCHDAAIACQGGAGPGQPDCFRCASREWSCQWAFRCLRPQKARDPNRPKKGRKPSLQSPLVAQIKPRKAKPPPGVNKYKYRADEDGDEDETGSSDLSDVPSENDDLKRKGGGRFLPIEPTASGSGSKRSNTKGSKRNGKEMEMLKEEEKPQRPRRDSFSGRSISSPEVKNESMPSPSKARHHASNAKRSQAPPHKHDLKKSPPNPKKHPSTSIEHVVASTSISTAAPMPSHHGIPKRKKVIESDSEEEVAAPREDHPSNRSVKTAESTGKDHRKGKAKAIDRDIDSTVTTKEKEDAKPTLKVKLKVPKLPKVDVDQRQTSISDDADDAERAEHSEKVKRRRDEGVEHRDRKRPRLDDGMTSGDGGKFSDNKSERKEEQTVGEERGLGRKSNKKGGPTRIKDDKQGKKTRDDDEPDPTLIVEGKRNRKPAREHDFAYSDDNEDDESFQRKVSRKQNKRSREEEASFGDASLQVDVEPHADDAPGDRPKNKKKKSDAMTGATIIHKQVMNLKKQGETPVATDFTSTSLEKSDRAAKMDPSTPTSERDIVRHTSDAATTPPNGKPAVQERKPLVGSVPKKPVAAKIFDPFADTLMRMSGTMSGASTPNKER